MQLGSALRIRSRHWPLGSQWMSCFRVRCPLVCQFAAISLGWGNRGLGSSSVEAREVAFAMPPVQHPARALGPGLPPGVMVLHRHQL